MIESPLLDEFLAEERAKTRAGDVLISLDARFGPVPPELQAAIREIQDLSRLEALVRAASCADDLDSFQRQLRS